jgi:hypothetical protein
MKNPLTSYEGWIMFDNHVNPGIPDELTRGFMPPGAGKGLYEVATLTCVHCGQVAIKNPDRSRPRNFCVRCSRYICDICGALAAAPDYVHRSFEQLKEMVQSGKFVITGGTARNPTVVSIEDLKDG